MDKKLGKPTKETELLRIWDNVKDKDQFKDEEGFEIDLGDGCKITAMDFNEMRDKKTKELVFAYKFKYPEDGEKFILYHQPVKNEKTEEILKMLGMMAEVGGYKFCDFEEHLKSIKVEFDIMKNKQEKKKK